LYLEKYEPEAFLAMKTKDSIKPSVTQEFHLHVFNTNLNYSFGYTRSDTYEKCDSLKLKLEKETDEDTTRALQVEKNLHLHKAQQFYDNLEYITEMVQHDKSTEGLRFDYQQNLPVPVLRTGEVWFYMGIYSCKTGCIRMYMYNETTRKKG
jgi:hypothetical protein